MRRAAAKREPNTTSARSSTMGARILGYSFGSYSRSASWMITTSPVAALMPVRSAAPLPWFTSCSSSWSMRPASSPFSRSRVPSREQSSTTMISLSGHGEACTASRMRWMVATSL
jgi:hypothetical protein